MIDSEVEKIINNPNKLWAVTVLESAGQVFQHEAPLDRAMRQLIRLLRPQLRAQRPPRGCLPGKFNAPCRYRGDAGWHP